MARLFNIEIFNKVINKSTNYYSDVQFNELLGGADSVILQVIVDAVAAADTVTVQHQVSNDGSPTSGLWTNTSAAPTVSPTSVTDVPKASMARTASTDTMGAFGRVQVSCTTTNGVAVRVIACGRTDV